MGSLWAYRAVGLITKAPMIWWKCSLIRDFLKRATWTLTIYIASFMCPTLSLSLLLLLLQGGKITLDLRFVREKESPFFPPPFLPFSSSIFLSLFLSMKNKKKNKKMQQFTIPKCCQQPRSHGPRARTDFSPFLSSSPRLRLRPHQGFFFLSFLFPILFDFFLLMNFMRLGLKRMFWQSQSLFGNFQLHRIELNMC